MTEWIKTKDRLPTLNTQVLVYIPKMGIHSAIFRVDDGDFKGIVGGWESCCYCGGESQVDLVGLFNNQIFTHWMHCPEFPND